MEDPTPAACPQLEEMAVWPLVAILEITGTLVVQVLGQALVTPDLAPVEILVALGRRPMVEILVDHGQTQGLLEAVVDPGIMVVLLLEDHQPDLPL